jgi:hypothetical protein
VRTGEGSNETRKDQMALLGKGAHMSQSASSQIQCIYSDEAARPSSNPAAALLLVAGPEGTAMSM